MTTEWFGDFIGHSRRTGAGRAESSTATKLDELDAKLAALAVALGAVREEIAATRAERTPRSQ